MESERKFHPGRKGSSPPLPLAPRSERWMRGDPAREGPAKEGFVSGGPAKKSPAKGVSVSGDPEGPAKGVSVSGDPAGEGPAKGGASQKVSKFVPDPPAQAFLDEVSKFVPELVLSFVSFQMEQLHPSSFIGIQFAICYVTWPMWRIECPANIKIYIDAAVVVLIYYVSLLKINLSYIWLAIFPFMVLVFIGALCNELIHQSGSQRRDNGEARSRNDVKTREPEGLKLTLVIPYWALCWIGRYGPDDSFIVSQFLLFLSSTLGALTLMMARLASTGVAPGIAPASELLRKASLVVLLVTVHTMAAEFLGEDVVLFCLPELVPVLLWFSLHLDRGSPIISVDEIKSRQNWLIVLGAVLAPAFAYIAASMDESGLSWCTRTSVSFGVSGLLIYYVVFMLCQWPGQAGTTTLKDAVQLLKFWANLLLIAAAVLLVFTSLAAARLGLHGPKVATLAKSFDDYVPRFSN